MKIVIIGGSGHVGSWLVPRLVEAGHEVTNVSRGTRTPYRKHPAWNHVEHRTIDREAAESDGNFGGIIAGLAPDAVIDMICFTPESARHLVEALRGKVRHFLHCGTIWVHGHSDEVPTTEDRPRRPICEYGRRKAAIEDFLLGEARRGGFPATVLHPGHIVGPGWAPLNPAGNFNPEVFRTLSRGETLALPHHGMETVHHVHADDVARAFILTIDNWRASVGENFHVVSPRGAYPEALRRGGGALVRQGAGYPLPPLGRVVRGCQ